MIEFTLVVKFLIENKILSVRELLLLAQTCQLYRSMTMVPLLHYKEVYYKWLPRLGVALHRWYLNHPIKYTSKISTIQKITNNTPSSEFGLFVMNFRPFPFTEEFMHNHRVAMSSVVIWVRKYTDLSVTLCLHHTEPEPIILGVINIDATELTPINDNLWFVNVDIPSDKNPLLFGYPLVPPNKAFIAISRKLNIIKQDGEELYDITYDPDFMYENVDRLIVNYLVVEHDRYNWDHFELNYTDDCKMYTKTGIIRRKKTVMEEAFKLQHGAVSSIKMNIVTAPDQYQNYFNDNDDTDVNDSDTNEEYWKSLLD